MVIPQPYRNPRLVLLSGSPRNWVRRFWDPEALFEVKLAMLAVVMLLGALLGA